MYTFLMGNQNLYMDRTSKFLSGPRLQKLEKIESEIKKKIVKMKDFSNDLVYYSDESENETPQTKNFVSKSKTHSPLKTSITCHLRQSMNNIPEHKPSNTILNQNHSLTEQKMRDLKNTMKYLDVIVFLLLTIGYIFAQFENEDFYLSNLQERSQKSIIINFMINNNITNLTPVYKIENNTKFTEITLFRNITINDILQYSDPSNVKVDLELSNYSNTLRFALLISTLITIPLIYISRYIEFQRDYIYREKLEINFYSTNLFYISILEILITLIFPYPYLSTYFIVTDLNYSFVMPVSSILSSFCFIRFYFLLKLLKHLTKWTSIKAETVCEKYVCKADSQFAFKAFQKENPFVLLGIIFVLTCLCFGLSLRIFELYFWETQNPDTNYNPLYQDWTYVWNSMWCIFVAMATGMSLLKIVGYGDFYPKTHFGRIVTIIACLIGIYFVSMMMVFMTEKSILTENEYKAFKLITRLKERKMIRSIQSMMIYQSLLMAKFKKEYNQEMMNERQFHIKYNYQKRFILSEIEDIKAKLRIIKSYDIVPTKEQLFDISERIETDFSEIKKELDSLKWFTDVQLESLKYLKKNIYATKILFNVLEKKNNFGRSFKVDKEIRELFMDKSLSSKKEDKISKEIILSNPQQFHSHFITTDDKRESKQFEIDSDLTNQLENFNENNFTQEQILDNFDFVLSNKSKSSNNKISFNKKKTVAFNVQLEPLKKIESHLKKKFDTKID